MNQNNLDNKVTAPNQPSEISKDSYKQSEINKKKNSSLKKDMREKTEEVIEKRPPASRITIESMARFY